MTDTNMNTAAQNAVEAAVFRRLIAHLDSHKDVQNIDLMILADFCRNCLSKWYVAAAKEQGIDISIKEAHQVVYKMSYDEWKQNFQQPATPEQLAALERRRHSDQ